MFLYLHFLQRTFYTLICDPTSSRRASASSLAASWLRGRSLVLTAGLSGRRSEQKHQIAKPLRHLDREGGGVSFNTLVDENQPITKGTSAVNHLTGCLVAKQIRD